MKTSVQEIVSYWKMREDECGLGIDWADAHERCWRCGYKSTLQRCHIVPDALGGPDHPSNLVLLCGRCHREAPNIDAPHYMWIWLRSTSVPLYDTYWAYRGYEEFEKMFHRKPFSLIEERHISQQDLEQLIRDALLKTTRHFGEGRINPSTIACILAQIEGQLIHETPHNKLE